MERGEQDGYSRGVRHGRSVVRVRSEERCSGEEERQGGENCEER